MDPKTLSNSEGPHRRRPTTASRRTFIGSCLGAGVVLSGNAASIGSAGETGPGHVTDHVLWDVRPAHPKPISREEARGMLLELLGVETIPKHVELAIGATKTTEDGLRVARVTYQNALKETVPAVLIVPGDVRPQSLPGIVCMSGTTGSAERVGAPRFYRQERGRGPLIGWGRELARRGFATLSLTLKGTTARWISPEHWEAQAKYLRPYGRTLMGVMVDEALRGAAILAEDEVVDPKRIGLAGMSLGGNVAWYSMACAPQMRAAVAICGGIGSMAAVIHGDDPGRHSSYFYIPHMLRYFDHPQIVAACIAPRAFMTVSPTMDEDMPRAGVDQLVRTVRPVYEAAGRAERFKVYQPHATHSFTRKHFEWTAAWLGQHC